MSEENHNRSAGTHRKRCVLAGLLDLGKGVIHMRSMWQGAIQFGMVIAPIKLYAATESQEVSLHLVHDKCGTQIKQERRCPTCDVIVGFGETDRGYTVAEGQMVQLNKNELSQLRVPSAKLIELIGFVPVADAPGRLHIHSSDFVIPSEVGQKPLGLMMQAMTKRKRLGVAKVSLRHRERLCLMQPLIDGRLALHTLRWADEVRSDKGYILEAHKFDKSELDMALQLVDMMTEPVDLESHGDPYRDALTELVQTKISSGEINQQPVDEPTAAAAPLELMAQMKESVEAAQKRKPRKVRTSKNGS